MEVGGCKNEAIPCDLNQRNNNPYINVPVCCLALSTFCPYPKHCATTHREHNDMHAHDALRSSISTLVVYIFYLLVVQNI